MEPASQLLILFAIVLGVNMLPAFGPPTWSIIVLYGFNTDLPVGSIIATGALAAALGRYWLARGFRLLGAHVSEKTQANLAAARAAFERSRRNSFLALGLFALSPVPSAQLFEAAGLARVRLGPFTLAFFVGRVASYSIYALGAKGIQQSAWGHSISNGISGPWGIGLQLLMIAGVIALARIDWARWFTR